MNGGTSRMNNVYNPYKKRSATDDSAYLEKQAQDIQYTTGMVTQSQWQNGSIKKCKNMATKRGKKRKKSGRDDPEDDEPFVPHKHCKKCHAIRHGLRIPHRPHHERCANNKNCEGPHRPMKSSNIAAIKNFFDGNAKKMLLSMCLAKTS